MVAPGAAVVVRGAATGEDRVALPERRVLLLLRVPNAQWRRVGDTVLLRTPLHLRAVGAVAVRAAR